MELDQQVCFFFGWGGREGNWIMLMTEPQIWIISIWNLNLTVKLATCAWCFTDGVIMLSSSRRAKLLRRPKKRAVLITLIPWPVTTPLSSVMISLFTWSCCFAASSRDGDRMAFQFVVVSSTWFRASRLDGSTRGIGRFSLDRGFRNDR